MSWMVRTSSAQTRVGWILGQVGRSSSSHFTWARRQLLYRAVDKPMTLRTALSGNDLRARAMAAVAWPARSARCVFLRDPPRLPWE